MPVSRKQHDSSCKMQGLSGSQQARLTVARLATICANWSEKDDLITLNAAAATPKQGSTTTYRSGFNQTHTYLETLSIGQSLTSVYAYHHGQNTTSQDGKPWSIGNWAPSTRGCLPPCTGSPMCTGTPAGGAYCINNIMLPKSINTIMPWKSISTIMP